MPVTLTTSATAPTLPSTFLASLEWYRKKCRKLLTCINIVDIPGMWTSNKGNSINWITVYTCTNREQGKCDSWNRPGLLLLPLLAKVPYLMSIPESVFTKLSLSLSLLSPRTSSILSFLTTKQTKHNATQTHYRSLLRCGSSHITLVWLFDTQRILHLILTYHGTWIKYRTQNNHSFWSGEVTLCLNSTKNAKIQVSCFSCRCDFSLTLQTVISTCSNITQ